MVVDPNDMRIMLALDLCTSNFSSGVLDHPSIVFERSSMVFHSDACPLH